MTFQGWAAVARGLNVLCDEERRKTGTRWLDEGQCRAVAAIASRISDHGLLLADEVGMGKTRIAVALARCVREAGGRVAVLIPVGLGYQWQKELRDGHVPCDVPPLRSLGQYFDAWMTSRVKCHLRLGRCKACCSFLTPSPTGDWASNLRHGAGACCPRCMASGAEHGRADYRVAITT